jgi:hypothetical protein
MMAHKTIWTLPIAILIAATIPLGCDLSSNNTNQGLGEKTHSEKNQVEKSSDPTPDDDGNKFTILLYLHQDPSHVKAAMQHKIDAEQHTGWDDIYVVHKDGHSELFMGRYKTREDAQKALKKVHAFAYEKRPIYGKAIIARIPGQDTTPTTFDLRNAPTGKKYSVQVAVFYDIPQKNYLGHQQRAIDLCQRLRNRGDEAYYYLTPDRSCVTLGSFPPEAIETKRVKKIHPKTGGSYREDKNYIKSKEMQAILDDNPYLLVCGNNEIRYVRTKTNERKEVRQKTYPIVIPSR